MSLPIQITILIVSNLLTALVWMNIGANLMFKVLVQNLDKDTLEKINEQLKRMTNE